MRYLLCLVCMFFGWHVLNAQVADGDHILIYDDGLIKPIARAIKDELARDLKKRDIKLSFKTKRKQLSLLNLTEQLEKDVLKKKPNHVVLAFGNTDVYDRKEEQILSVEILPLKAALEAAIKQLQDAGCLLSLIGPGLCGEDKAAAGQSQVNAFAEMMQSVAKEHELGFADLRTPAFSWLEQNPPKKPGRLQLTKDGITWEKEAASIVVPKIIAAMGLSKSSIQRPLKYDERIIIASPLGAWAIRPAHHVRVVLDKMSFEKPEGFFNPAVKGPMVSDFMTPENNIYEKTFPIKELNGQKPTVAFVYISNRFITQTDKNLDVLQANLDQMMSDLSNQSYPVFVFTPWWMNELNAAKLGEKGPVYERCKQSAEIIRISAAKYGVPIIDLFAISEETHQQNKDMVFHSNNDGYGTMSRESMILLKGEIFKVLEIK